MPAFPICPASRFPHLVISCCLLGLPMPSPLCRLIACIPSSSRAAVPSSHPSSRAISSVISGNSACVPPLRPASRLVLRPASRLASRSVLPWDVIAVLPDRFSWRSACRHRSPRPACRLGWERDKTGEPLSPSPARLAAAACSGMAWGCVCSDCGVLPACSTGDRFVSVL